MFNNDDDDKEQKSSGRVISISITIGKPGFNPLDKVMEALKGKSNLKEVGSNIVGEELKDKLKEKKDEDNNGTDTGTDSESESSRS